MYGSVGPVNPKTDLMNSFCDRSIGNLAVKALEEVRRIFTIMLALSLLGAAFQLTQRTRSAEIIGAQPTPRRTQVRTSIKPQRKLLVRKINRANLFFFASRTLKARNEYPTSKPVYTPKVEKSKGFKISESSLIFSPNLRQFSVLINNLETDFVIPDTKPNS